jgi:hypothetical protein
LGTGSTLTACLTATGFGTATELAKVPKSDGTTTWNDTAKATLQTECNDALIANNLDHLALTATGSADMTTEIADNTILSRIIGNGDTSTFIPSTDGLRPTGVDLDSLIAAIITNAAGTDVAADIIAIQTAIDGFATDTDVANAVAAQSDFVLLSKWFKDKLVRTDNLDGTITYVLYDDNNSTPILTWVYTTATGTRAKAT